MNAETKIEAGSDIALVDAREILTNQETFKAWLVQTKESVESLDADMSIKKNRDATRSAAAKIASKKAEIDRARLGLTKDMRDQIDKINADGKSIKEKLEALQADVRAPLDEWEEAEQARIDRCTTMIAGMREYAKVSIDDTSEAIRDRGNYVFELVLDPSEFGDMLAEAQTVKDLAIDTLKGALARALKDEAEREELVKLRAEAEARAEADRIAEEKAEAARIEAARIESERLAAEQAEADRLAAIEAEKEATRIAEEQRLAQIEQARADAAAQALRDAEAAAQADRDRIQAEHDAELAAERKRADELAAAEAERIATKAREDAETARREKNRAHRSRVMGEAKIAIMSAGAINEEAAIAIVKAIVAAKVPHVSLEF